MADHTEQLRQAAQARHQNTLAKAAAALSTLACTPEPITFGRLARTAGVSRSWLYRQPELRRQIEQLRSSSPRQSPVPAAQRASDESNRQKIALYREELERLRAENRDLREQLARKFGAARAAAMIDQL